MRQHLSAPRIWLGRPVAMPAQPAHRRGNACARAPSVGAYTAYHAYTTSAHSEVWEVCAVYAPAERGRAQTSLSEEIKEEIGMG